MSPTIHSLHCTSFLEGTARDSSRCKIRHQVGRHHSLPQLSLSSTTVDGSQTHSSTLLHMVLMCMGMTFKHLASQDRERP